MTQQKKTKKSTSSSKVKASAKSAKSSASKNVVSLQSGAKKPPAPKTAKKKQARAQAQNEMSLFNLKEIIMNMNNTKNFEKMSQDAANMSKEAMEACQKSATILAKNSQDCMSSYMSMMQAAAEKQNKLMKEMLSKKTINEMSETLQSASQESFNEMMQNMSKLSEQSIKAVMDSYEPLNSQVNKTVKKASDNIAA